MIIARNNGNISDNLIRQISDTFSVSGHFASFLIRRGIDSIDKVNAFLYPDARNLYDCYLLDGISEAKKRIITAKARGEKVAVFGDYDADGITATTILVRSLSTFGIEAQAIIPEREDGYGLKLSVLDRLKETPDLVITVDCGISAFDEIDELKRRGIDVIVTDHHEIMDKLPDCTVINCKIEGSYPFNGLCGAGVAYKLAYSLIGEKANAYLDLVALATVADSMSLSDENRILVFEGIKLINKRRCCKAIKAIMNVSQVKEITSSALAFTIAPRVNAAGRMGDAYSGLKVILSDNDDEVNLFECQ
ncbi:MAG: DHH family phosphoesterase, partial [Clostridia bacterium]|nr:DHH family phosphoesterase [Clostridia bacterium]